jgi:hypothetical protein
MNSDVELCVVVLRKLSVFIVSDMSKMSTASVRACDYSSILLLQGSNIHVILLRNLRGSFIFAEVATGRDLLGFDKARCVHLIKEMHQQKILILHLGKKEMKKREERVRK